MRHIARLTGSNEEEGMRLRNVVVMAVLVMLASAAPAAATDLEFTVFNIEYEGTKVWVPSTLVAYDGDNLKIKLINNVKSDPNQHGFAIAPLNVAAVVNRGEPQTVEIKAVKKGIYP